MLDFYTHKANVGALMLFQDLKRLFSDKVAMETEEGPIFIKTLVSASDPEVERYIRDRVEDNARGQRQLERCYDHPATHKEAL